MVEHLTAQDLKNESLCPNLVYNFDSDDVLRGSS